MGLIFRGVSLKSPPRCVLKNLRRSTQGENDAEGHTTKEQYGNSIITDRVYVRGEWTGKKITTEPRLRPAQKAFLESAQNLQLPLKLPPRSCHVRNCQHNN